MGHTWNLINSTRGTTFISVIFFGSFFNDFPKMPVTLSEFEVTLFWRYLASRWVCNAILTISWKCPVRFWPYPNSGWPCFGVIWHPDELPRLFWQFPENARFGFTGRSQVNMSYTKVVPLIETNNFCRRHFPDYGGTISVTRVFEPVGGHFRWMSCSNFALMTWGITDPQTDLKSLQWFLRKTRQTDGRTDRHEHPDKVPIGT